MTVTTTITAAAAKAAATVIAVLVDEPGKFWMILSVFVIVHMQIRTQKWCPNLHSVCEFIHKSGVRICIVYASSYIKVVY